MPLKPSWHLFALPSVSEHTSTDDWQLLEGFLRQLEELQGASRQIRSMLDTVQRMVRADLVFACSTQDQGPVHQAGPRPNTAPWCRALLRRLLELTPEGDAHICRLAGNQPDPIPASTALVRLSRSRDVWIVAAVFDPDRSLRKSDVQLMRLARRMLLQQNRQSQTFSQLREALVALVHCLTAALDARDPYTWGHSERVARMGVRIGQELGLAEAEVNDLYLGGLLHDIGKIGVRDDILRKPASLTPEERTLVEKHTVIGDTIIAHVSQLAHLRTCVRSHHERVDGLGYPDRLVGVAIPLPARILAVADACDAMLSARPYRKGMSRERIDQILCEGSGAQWDAEVVTAFLACKNDVYGIHERGVGESIYRAVEQVLRSPGRVGNLASMTGLAARTDNTGSSV